MKRGVNSRAWMEYCSRNYRGVVIRLYETTWDVITHTRNGYWKVIERGRRDPIIDFVRISENMIVRDDS